MAVLLRVQVPARRFSSKAGTELNPEAFAASLSLCFRETLTVKPVKPDLGTSCHSSNSYASVRVLLNRYRHALSPAEVGEKVFAEVEEAIRVDSRFREILDFRLILRFFFGLTIFSPFLV
jgi:hypothetical protein